MTLLSLIQQACGELGIIAPTQVVGAMDDQATQLLALSQREGREFSQMANKNSGWQALFKEYTFLTVALPSTTGNLVAGSAVITSIPSTAGIVANTWTVIGAGITNQGTVISVDSPTQVTMDRTSTLTQTGATLSFGKSAYPIPSDLKYFVTQTFWDANYRWQLLGPLEAQERDVIRWGISPVGPRRRFWFRDNLMIINPTPSVSGDMIAYDYYSSGWCSSASGTPQSLWAADTDVYNLDDDCFVLGLKYRFRQAKGLDYTKEIDDYRMACQRVMARDGGNRNLPLNSSASGLRLLNDNNIPDTGYGT